MKRNKRGVMTNLNDPSPYTGKGSIYPMKKEKEEEEYYCTLTIRFRTREAAEKIVNSTCKKLIETEDKDITWELDVVI